MTSFLLHIDTVREHPQLVADLRNAGAEVTTYDDYDYVSDPQLRALLDSDDQLLAEIDPSDLH